MLGLKLIQIDDKGPQGGYDFTDAAQSMIRAK